MVIRGGETIFCAKDERTWGSTRNTIVNNDGKTN